MNRKVHLPLRGEESFQVGEAGPPVYHMEMPPAKWKGRPTPAGDWQIGGAGAMVSHTPPGPAAVVATALRISVVRRAEPMPAEANAATVAALKALLDQLVDGGHAVSFEVTAEPPATRPAS